MIKIYCDRCGEEIGEHHNYTIRVQAPEIRAWGDDYVYDIKDYQICRNCMKEVDEFITSQTEQQTETTTGTDCSWK